MFSFPQGARVLINELSKRTGLSVHTIRFYERYGFIQGHRNDSATNNYFQYDEEAVAKLELVIDAKSVGFTLQEISEILNAWYTDLYNKDQKRLILENKIAVLDERIKELRNMKKQIRECIDEL